MGQQNIGSCNEVMAPTLRYSNVPGEVVFAFCEQSYKGRVYDPLTSPDASVGLLDQRNTWADEGLTTVFTSGAYDLGPHGNHRSYLKGMRVIAAPYHYEAHDAQREGRTWEELAPAQQQDYLHHVVGSDSIKLIVSVDGDAALDNRKSGDPSKAGTRRPFFSWDTRIRGILDYCDVINGQPHVVVDAVTMHDNQIPGLTGTPHAGIMEIGAHLQPDVWGIFFESEDILDAITADRTGEFSRIIPVVLSHCGLYSDKFVGPLSTTRIAKHVGGVTLALPTT